MNVTELIKVINKITPLDLAFDDDKVGLLIGSEEKGISKGILKIINEKIKIPMTGNVESLNVSVAASIALFEVKRQRNS